MVDADCVNDLLHDAAEPLYRRALEIDRRPLGMANHFPQAPQEGPAVG